MTPHRRSFDGPGLLAALGIAGALFALSWLRHRNHWTGFDLAIFDQGAWQISQGRTHISIVERHVMADHFSPVLYLFGALYRVAATPVWLFGAQALALGATVLPMRGIARHLGLPESRATALLALSGPLLAAGLFDFHPATLAVPFLAAAVLCGLQDRPVAAALAGVAAAACRADLALVLVAAAVVARPRARASLLGVGAGAALVSAVLPGRFGDTNGWSPHFGHLGSGPVDAVLHPWEPLGHLLSPSSLSILLLWVVAAGAAVVLRPRWMVAVVLAGLPVLLSRWEGTELPWYHYGAPVAVLAMAGTMAALSTTDGSSNRWVGRVRALWWGGPLLVLLVASPLSPAAPDVNRIWNVALGDDGRDVDGAVALVGDAEAVTADQRVLPHLSQRERAYLFPIPFGDAPDFFAEGSQPDLDGYGPDAVDVVVAGFLPQDLVASGELEVVAELDGLVVLRRVGAPGRSP